MRKKNIKKRAQIIVPLRTKKLDGFDYVTTFASISKMIELAKGIALMVYIEQIDPQQIADRFDGLLVPGGGDIDPQLYHQSIHPKAGKADRALDQMDLSLIHAFAKRNKPILGICRGMQCINVAFGGTLYQDIPSYFPQLSNAHDQEKQEGFVTYENSYGHQVIMERNTRLHQIFGDRYPVNSFHHQAVDQVADGFMISAVSSDGLVEGIERGNIIGVQWHPELLDHDKKQNELFQRFIADAIK